MASSSVVIKVKFGNTLRRFNAPVRDGKLDLDMVRLSDKIRCLLNIAHDVGFTLNYIDEDGDLVTLADEEDLRDVVRQSLDPLRITVRLDADKGVPEAHQDALSKLFDLASKATSSVPMVAELMEKMKNITLNQLSEAQRGPVSRTHNETAKGPKFPVHAEVGSSNSKKKAVQTQQVNGGVKLGDAQPPGSLDLNVPCFDPETFHYPDNKGVKKLAYRNCAHAAYHPNLDSRFVLDINILDGTVMAPKTGFTKIWRMKNNGNVYWPHGSQLRWIAGDRLSNVPYVDVEIPFEGLPMGKEIDIAVDLTAPKLPGRYVSYWRMAAPSGQMFGQRVWALIQVDASVKDMGDISLSLNLPGDTKDPRVGQGSLKNSVLPDRNMIMKVMNGEDPFSDAKPKETNFPLNDMRINNNGVSATGTGAYVPLAPAGSMDSPGLLPRMVHPHGFSVEEEALLRELEDMGFMQVDLNKEVLRMNGYNLEQSVDHLYWSI